MGGLTSLLSILTNFRLLLLWLFSQTVPRFETRVITFLAVNYYLYWTSITTAASYT